MLPTLPADHFHCAVTSPPYFGLRDYGCVGQIGLEPTLDAYLAEMVAVCREVRRVLRPEGTFWLNIGDSYSKEKQLLLVPSRLALALQTDGWLLRSEIIWHKPNPMPEPWSVKRPTSSHEKVWLFVKSKNYFFDGKAIAEKALQPLGDIETASGKGSQRKQNAIGQQLGKSSLGANHGAEWRNTRNVWSIAPKPFKEAHFATFPPELAERCIKAGCPVGGHVLDPFGGAGTTGLVAKQLGRNATLVELNSAYIEMARRRVVDMA